LETFHIQHPQDILAFSFHNKYLPTLGIGNQGHTTTPYSIITYPTIRYQGQQPFCTHYEHIQGPSTRFSTIHHTHISVQSRFQLWARPREISQNISCSTRSISPMSQSRGCPIKGSNISPPYAIVGVSPLEHHVAKPKLSPGYNKPSIPEGISTGNTFRGGLTPVQNYFQNTHTTTCPSPNSQQFLSQISLEHFPQKQGTPQNVSLTIEESDLGKMGTHTQIPVFHPNVWAEPPKNTNFVLHGLTIRGSTPQDLPKAGPKLTTHNFPGETIHI